MIDGALAVPAEIATDPTVKLAIALGGESLILDMADSLRSSGASVCTDGAW